MTDERKIPEGRLGRFARLATVGLRSGASLLRGSDGNDAARMAADVLGTMRGLAAKVGQMASYIDGVVPEGQRDAYEGAMKALRAAAPRSNSSDIRALVEADLAAPIDKLFSRFEEEPFASASIGQVHRAALHDGLEVAVKVQHPGVAKAIKSDLSNASIVESLATMTLGRRVNAKDVMAVVRKRFEEELDYGLEAQRVQFFDNVHSGDSQINIPRLIETHSSKRVLTTEFLHGRDFDQACAAGESERRAWAETLWRFVFKGNLVAQHFNADPHPGNYVFLEDGRVGFLDFGCVQRIPDDHWRWARRAHRAAVDGNAAAFRHAILRLLDAREGKLAEMALAYIRECFNPLFDAPFRMTRPYAAGLVQGMKELGLAARKAPADEFFTMPPEMLFMNRLQFGFYSVLARLDVDVDYASVERAFLGQVD